MLRFRLAAILLFKKRISVTMQRAKNALTTKVATQIIEFVRRHELPVGHHLTEQAIVNAIHVSRSPVRKAMRFLEELGVLRGEKNRGFFLNKSPKALARLTAPANSDNGDATYLQISDDRLRRKLADEISESDLMRRYEISRVQAQHILHRMFREGLVLRKQGRGWQFLPILDSIDSHNESYRFRMIIEPAAVLEPGFRVNQAEFNRCRREQEAMLAGDILRLSRVRLFQIGSEFHEMIVACSGNRFLLDAIRRQNQLRRVIEYRAHLDRSRLTRQCQEHLKLLDLLENGNRERAAEFLRKHLDVVRTIKTSSTEERSLPTHSAVHAQL